MSWASSRTSPSVFPRSRSTALLKTHSGSDAIFTLAMASTLSGMLPLEKALLTDTSMGMVSRFMCCTVSMMGTRSVRPPEMERYPTVCPSEDVRLRPVSTAAWLGGTITIRLLMVMTNTITATRITMAIVRGAARNSTMCLLLYCSCMTILYYPVCHSSISFISTGTTAAIPGSMPTTTTD